MSSAMRPNEQMRLDGLGVPVDPMTGHRLESVVLQRLQRLKDADAVYRDALHELDGTTPGSRPGDRRMAIAFTKLDEVKMWAVAAIMDHHGS